MITANPDAINSSTASFNKIIMMVVIATAEGIPLKDVNQI